VALKQFACSLRSSVRTPEFLIPFSRRLLAVMTLACTMASAADQAPEAWKYLFHAGDHLVYAYSLDRETISDNSRIRTHAEFTSHVLILGTNQQRLAVGFQRNRESAELLEFIQNGKNRLAQETPRFRQRMAGRPRAFSEANEFSYTGSPLQFWEAARESPSKLLFAIHEIEILPEKKLSPGGRWRGNRLLGLEFRLAAVETIGSSQCDRIEGKQGSLHLQFWWCPDSHAIQKLEFDGQYPVFSGTAHERIIFELKNKSSDQKLQDWLNSPDIRYAALSSLLRSPTVAAPPEVLEPALHAPDTETQSMALAIMYQRGMLPRDRALLSQLQRSEDRQVSRIARRVNSESSEKAAPGSFPPETAGTTIRVLQSSKYQGLPYGLRIPPDYKGSSPSPLLIYLSGGAGLAMDAVNTADDKIKHSDYVVLYPQAAGLWWESEAVQKFSAVFDEVSQHVNIDPSRIFIAGFSNGGTGALYYATRWPHRFRAVISLMGAGQCMPDVEAEMSKLKGVPILLVHGERDPIIPGSCSKQTYERLVKLSPESPPEIHILKDREHDLSLNDDGGFSFPFLEAHRDVR
jgi:dienelactone hydrolase